MLEIITYGSGYAVQDTALPVWRWRDRAPVVYVGTLDGCLVYRREVEG